MRAQSSVTGLRGDIIRQMHGGSALGIVLEESNSDNNQEKDAPNFGAFTPVPSKNVPPI